jgi:hypothetical protein
VQVTIDLPERLAKQVELERDHLAEIFELGLRQRCARASGIRREVVSFLARGPRPDEIAAFRPSEQATARARELLWRNREKTLTPAEEAEMDDIAEVDRLFSQLKAEALLHQRPAA